MASKDGLLTLVGRTTGADEEDIDVSALTTAGAYVGDSVNLLVDGRPLGRGKPLFVQVQLAEDATANVNVELWTSPTVDSSGQLSTGSGPNAVAPVQVASVSFTDSNDAGDSRFIHLQDNTRQYIQLRVSGAASQSGADFAYRAWIDTARITSTAIINAEFVGHESYSSNTAPYGAE